MSSLVEKYRIGMITEDHLVVECLNMVDPEHPGRTLNNLPDSIFPRMIRFANDYLHGPVVTNYGALPTRDQVLAAKKWIEELLQQKASKTA